MTPELLAEFKDKARQRGLSLFAYLAHFVSQDSQTGLQHLKNVSAYKLVTYKSAKTLWHYISSELGRLGQLAQRGGCGNSGRP